MTTRIIWQPSRTSKAYWFGYLGKQAEPFSGVPAFQIETTPGVGPETTAERIVRYLGTTDLPADSELWARSRWTLPQAQEMAEAWLDEMVRDLERTVERRERS